MSRQPDAVVVGAGIVGAACALALARDGLRVLVLESGCAGGGTTAAAMGHLVVMDDSEAQFALTAWSLRLWTELATDLPADCEDDPCGTLWIAAAAGGGTSEGDGGHMSTSGARTNEGGKDATGVRTNGGCKDAAGVRTNEGCKDAAGARANESGKGAGGTRGCDSAGCGEGTGGTSLDDGGGTGESDPMERVQAKAAFYRARGVAAEVLDSAQLAAAEPRLRGGLAGALRVPGDRVIYPPNTVRYLLARAADHGAELREGFCVSRLAAGMVEGHGERIAAPLVVNAAGAAAPTLTPGLPIVPRKGHLVITDRHPGFCRHQLVELGYLDSAHGPRREAGSAEPATLPPPPPSVAFNVQPRATGQVLIGSSRELVGWDRGHNHALERRMIRRALSFLPSLAGVTALRGWNGFRPATPDNLPLIGPWPEVPGLWIAAGHEGLGIATSLATAHLLADLIAGRQPEIDPAPFAPDRLRRGNHVSASPGRADAGHGAPRVSR